MATENGTTTSVQDPSALEGGAPVETKGKGKAAATAEDVEDTSMAVDDEDEEDDEEEGDEVCRKPLPRASASTQAPCTNCAYRRRRLRPVCQLANIYVLLRAHN